VQVQLLVIIAVYVYGIIFIVFGDIPLSEFIQI
jgi:hypothetical protein